MTIKPINVGDHVVRIHDPHHIVWMVDNINMVSSGPDEELFYELSAPGFGWIRVQRDQIEVTDRPVSALEEFDGLRPYDQLDPDQEPMWGLIAILLLVVFAIGAIAFNIWPISHIPEITK